MYNAKVKNYQKEALKTRVAGANRYQIIQMLMMGTLEKLVLAKVSIERKDLAAKSENISKASAIINSLRDCLDFEVGGEVVENLYMLYTYMLDTLLDASLENSIDKIEEVAGLLKEIKAGWDAIPVDVREEVLSSSSQDASVG